VTIPITVRQLEAIVRIAEAIAKMSLSPIATETHVNEAIRLFNVSTLEAANTTSVGSDLLGAPGEVSNAEALLKRRLPIGSQISEKKVIEDFTKQGIASELSMRRAIATLIQRGELEYRNQRKKIYRKC
jgi:DNA replication licensing factor MCM5